MEPIVERIKEIIQAQRMTNSAFAQFIGIKQATLSHTLSGRNKKPSIDLVLAIASKCGVSFNWLMEGIEKDMPNFIRSYRGMTPTADDDTQMEMDEPSVVQNGLFDSTIEDFEVDNHTVVNNEMPVSSTNELPIDTVIEQPNQPKKPEFVPPITPTKPIHPDLQPQVEPQEMPASQVVTQIEYRDTPPRKVREICIYYDDGTYEYFVPRK